MKHYKKTYTYKSINQLELKVDVYNPNRNKKLPGIFWLHGGGLIMGDRNMIDERHLEVYLQQGFSVVSADYRLAPEFKLHEIFRDVEDAYYWMIDNANDFNIDTNRIGLVGHSAGSYLALQICSRVALLPGAIVLFYGYGDISANWANQVNTDYRNNGLISKDDAYQGISTSKNIFSNSEERLRFYLYCRQNGIWAKEIIGTKTSNNMIKTEYCPIYKITSKFPPTLLLHGDEDIDVPLSESVRLQKKLKSIGVQCDLIEFSGYNHYFDHNEDAFEDKKIVQGFNKIVEFLNQYLSS